MSPPPPSPHCSVKRRSAKKHSSPDTKTRLRSTVKTGCSLYVMPACCSANRRSAKKHSAPDTKSSPPLNGEDGPALYTSCRRAAQPGGEALKKHSSPDTKKPPPLSSEGGPALYTSMPARCAPADGWSAGALTGGFRRPRAAFRGRLRELRSNRTSRRKKNRAATPRGTTSPRARQAIKKTACLTTRMTTHFMVPAEIQLASMYLTYLQRACARSFPVTDSWVSNPFHVPHQSGEASLCNFPPDYTTDLPPAPPHPQILTKFLCIGRNGTGSTSPQATRCRKRQKRFPEGFAAHFREPPETIRARKSSGSLALFHSFGTV